MIFKPAIVGVRQVLTSIHPSSVKETMQMLGGNTGNMMFTEAINKVLVNSKSTSFQMRSTEIEGCDAIVFAAANWIGSGRDLNWLADLLEKTNLPAFLVGIGAQSSSSDIIPKIKPGTLRFLKIVSERSKNISTRGVFSSEVLEHYGIKNSIPTGCPSMLMAGRNGVNYTKDASLDRVTLQGTRHGFHHANSFQKLFYSTAYENNFDILLQSETADVIASLSNNSSENDYNLAKAFVRAAYGADGDEKAVTYLRVHGKLFTDYKSWIEYMKTRTFCIGSRIHGSIASLLSGTPAILVTHDSRTLELAQIMGIPHIESKLIDERADLPFNDFIDIFKNHDARQAHDEYKTRFDSFFADNGLNAKF